MKYNPNKNEFEESSEEIILPALIWHITDRCELNCKVCFVKERKCSVHDLNTIRIEKMLTIMEKLGVQKIDISGGDPLLYDALPFLVESAKKHGLYLTITTRGIGNSKNIQWMCNNWMEFTRIIVSIDGGSESICDEMSGYNNTLNHAVSLIRSLKKENCSCIRINTVVNRLILTDDAKEDLIKLIESLLPAEWCLIQPHPLNKRESFEDYSVKKEEFEDYYKTISERFNNSDIRILKRTNEIYSGYWALYPDDKLMRLSNGKDYSGSLVFDEGDVSKMADQIMRIQNGEKSNGNKNC